MTEALKALFAFWFVGIPALVVFVSAFLLMVAIAGAPLWIVLWLVWA
jgi:hypothetical protein